MLGIPFSRFLVILLLCLDAYFIPTIGQYLTCLNFNSTGMALLACLKGFLVVIGGEVCAYKSMSKVVVGGVKYVRM